jgi:hypothetical protein
MTPDAGISFPAVAENTRPLASDERALFDWFFEQWPELAEMRSALDLDASAEVFTLAEDGYTTLSVPYVSGAAGPTIPSPYRGEGRGAIDGHPFEVLFFADDDGAMVEVIWSAGNWPGRLPRPEEVQASERT